MRGGEKSHITTVKLSSEDGEKGAWLQIKETLQNSLHHSERPYIFSQNEVTMGERHEV